MDNNLPSILCLSFVYYTLEQKWWNLSFLVENGRVYEAKRFAWNKTSKNLTAHNWQQWKRVFLTCPCHKIYRDEAVGLKGCKYTWKITIFVKMWNLGQYRENSIFCQKLLNWSSNSKILLRTCDTYNCNYLKHSTFRFNLIDFRLNTDFPS